MDPRQAWCSRPPLPPYAAAPLAPAHPYPPPPPPNPYPAAPPAPVNPYSVAPPAPANPYTVAPPFQSQFYYQTTPPPPQPQQPPPLPPPPPHDPYDPFTDHHHPRPMMNPPPPQPWNSIPHPPEYLNPNYDNYAHAGVKRMRVEEFGEGHGLGQGQGQTRASNLDRNVNSNGSFNVSNDDERRLKLIREHGGSGVSDSRNGLELSSCSSFNKGNLRDFRLSNVDKREIVYDHDLSYNSSKRYHMVNDTDYVIGDGNNSSSGRMGTSGRVNGGYYDSNNRFGLERSELDDSCRMQQHGMEVKSGHYGSPYTNEQSGINRLHNQSSQMSLGRPFSASPSPPLPPPRAVEPFRSRLPESMVSTSPSGRAYFPISAGSDASKVATYPPLTEANPFSSTYLPHKGIQTIHHELPKTYQRESEQFPSQYTTSDVQKIVDASVLLKHPHRTTRPDHIVIILRGLPGSGKSYLAKMLRDLEVENGGKAPRIHTMDDYFMMEVEKIEESEGSKSSSSVRGRKQATKIVMEYCYEPEMEEAYRSSMLKAFKKTLDEGVYSFVIVDDRNLRVADFVQFWATAKRSGYEVYMLEAAYKDPVGCAARNIHGFTQDDIRKMADQWEEAPSMYMQLDIRSLLHGDKLLDNEIQEVDMDTGEGDPTCVPSCSDESNAGMVGAHSTSNGPHKDDKKHDATGPPYQKEDESKKLGNSKWSNDLDEDDAPSTYARERNLNTLPGLNQSYRKKGKSVHWGDKVANTGFSIGAAKMAYVSSLVIGPGAGYNLNTNPLTEADKTALRQNTGKMQNILREQLRAEHESFKAVFDKRRQRIGGLDLDEE